MATSDRCPNACRLTCPKPVGIWTPASDRHRMSTSISTSRIYSAELAYDGKQERVGVLGCINVDMIEAIFPSPAH